MLPTRNDRRIAWCYISLVNDRKSWQFDTLFKQVSKSQPLDPKLTRILSRTVHYILNNYFRSTQIKKLIDKNVQSLIIGCNMSGKCWRWSYIYNLGKLIKKTIDSLISDSRSWIYGRLDSKDVTLFCLPGSKRKFSNNFVEELYKARYDKGLRIILPPVRNVGEEQRSEIQPVDQIQMKEGGTKGTNSIIDHSERLKKICSELFTYVSLDLNRYNGDISVVMKLFRLAAIERMTPFVRHILQENPPKSLIEKKEVASKLNRVLGELGIAIEEPASKQPCSVIASPDRGLGGYFRLQAKRFVPGNVQQTSITEKLPPLELIEAPRQERLARPR